MRSLAFRTSAGGRLRLPAIALLAATTIVLLSLLPTAPAGAATPTVTAPPTEQVEEVLGQTPVGTLNPTELAETLSHVEGFEGVPSVQLKEALEKVIDDLSGEGGVLSQLLGSERASELKAKLDETLGPLATKLEELLHGNPTQKIEEALGSTGPSEVIGKLLSGSSEPQQVIEQVIQALGPEKLKELVGSVLSGEPFSKTTVEELAHTFGTSGEGLASQLGKTAEELPGTAMALVAPLSNGETLGVLNAAKGASLTVLKKAEEAAAGGNGGNGTGGNGAPGGNGGAGGSGTPGAPVTATSPSSPSPTGSAAGTKVGKARALSHRVKGSKATIVVEVPSAGFLTVTGRGIHRISRETAKGERVTLHPALTRAGSASLRKHHRRLKVPVKVSFKPVSGSSSSFSVPLTYR
jgi:hypothetical protein